MDVGRTGALHAVDALVTATVKGDGGAVVLRGEVGAGASSLLADACQRTRTAGGHDATVIEAAASSADHTVPYASLHRLVWPVRRGLADLPSPQAEALRRVAGLEAGPVDAGALPVATAVLSLLEGLAACGPVLCAIDDAHWLDPASARVLGLVAHRLDGTGVGMLLVVPIGERCDWARDLPEARLGDLDEAAARELVAELAGVPVADAVMTQLLAAVGGSPRGLREAAAGLTVDHWQGRRPLPDPLPLPWDVAAPLLEQVRRLPPASQRLLVVAAEEGTGDVGVLSAAADRLGLGRAALDPAVAAGLLRVDGAAVAFRHPLLGTAIRAHTGPDERRATHALIADVLETRRASDRAAWHRAAAAIGPDAPLAAALERSAERAARRDGPGRQAAVLERAAELTPTDGPRARRLVRAADAAWRAGRTAQSAELLRRTTGLPVSAAVAADLALLRGRMASASSSPHDARAVLVAGASAVVDVDAGRAATLMGEAARAAWMLDDVFPDLAADDAVQGLLTALVAGDDAAARIRGAEAAASARDRGDVAELLVVLGPVAAVDAWTSHPDEAMAAAQEARQLAQACDRRNHGALPAAVQAWVAAMRGDAVACRDHGAAARHRALGHDLRAAAAVAVWAHGLLELGAGHPAEALATLQVLFDRPDHGHDCVRPAAAGDLVVAAVRAGRPDVARDALRRLDELADAAPAVGWLQATRDRCHALVSAPDAAERHFESALAWHAVATRPFEQARTELSYGEALRRVRRRVDARGHLRRAEETFARLGAEPWRSRAAGELRASGEATGPGPSSVRLLTPQEARIVEMVRTGATNREIAADLFLSPRTVDYHLRKVYRRLGITSRAQLTHLDLPGVP